MADPEDIMFFVNSYAQDKGKPVFFPMNIEWGGYVLIFTHDSPKIEDIIGGRLTGNEVYMKLFEKTATVFPPRLLKLVKKLSKKL